jgi:hypothetical protein
LASIGREDRDLGGWIAEETHVLEYRHRILGLSQILDKVRRGFTFSCALIIGYVNKLVIELETRVRNLEVLVLFDNWKVPESFISPFEEFSDGGS